MWLDNIYAEYKQLVDRIAARQERVNFCMDESHNAASERIWNLCFSSAEGTAFFLLHESIGDADQTAEAIFARTKSNIAKQLQAGREDSFVRWDRVNSIAQDTCATNQAIRDRAARDPELNRVFFVNCDSHGLQLLFKDLTEGKYAPMLFKSTFRRANQLVRVIRKSKKSHAILRVLQRIELKGKTASFALMCSTRWGTIEGLFRSLIKNEKVLWRALKDPRFLHSVRNGKYTWIAEGNAAADTIKDANFWENLHKLHQLFEPIHEAQVISESGDAQVAYVLPRWQALRAHLLEFQSISDLPHLDEVLTLFDKRMKKQLQPIHYLAAALDPLEPAKSLSWAAEQQDMIIAAFRNHVGEIDSRAYNEAVFQLRTQFNSFTKQQGFYSPQNFELWHVDSHPSTFWTYAETRDKLELPQLAIRLLGVVANSVPSERSFSAMNYVQDTYRTRMSVPTMHKSVYCYMNARALRRQPYNEKQQKEREKARRQRAKAEVTEIKRINFMSLQQLVEAAR